MIRKPFRFIAMFVALSAFSVITACAPKEQKTTAPELIHKGWDSFAIGEFAIASKRFAQAETQVDATPDLRAEALYGRGMAESIGNTENAEEIPIAILNQSIAASPQSPWAGWSLLALARMKHRDAAKAEKDPDWESVRQAYQQVLDRFPDTPEAQEAFLMQQGTLLTTGKIDDAKRVLATVNAWLAKHPDDSMTVRCLDLLAECYNTLADGPHEVEARIKSLKTRQAQSTSEFNKAGIYWSIATRSEFECGDFAVARDYYRRLIAEYPSDQRVLRAKLAIARMDKLESDIREQLTTQPSTAAPSSQTSKRGLAQEMGTGSLAVFVFGQSACPHFPCLSRFAIDGEATP